MPLAAIEIFKKIAPILVIILLITGVWFHGYNSCDKKFTEYKALAEAKSQLINDQLTQSAKIIGETYEQNSKINSDLTNRNRKLLAERMQHGSPSNANPATPSASDETTPPYWVLPEQAGRDFIAEAARADEVAEIARSCQAYVSTIQSAINGGN
jgi:hypothetical protein